MVNKIFYFILFTSFSACLNSKQIMKTNENSFITVKGTQFLKNNKTYNFIGTNFWAGINLGANNSSGNRARLIAELNQMQSLGITNVRIMALTEGPNSEPFRIVPSNNNKADLDEDILQGLDFFLDELKKRDMSAVVCLSNFWPWSGGFAQYQQWVGDIKKIEYPMDTINGNWWNYMISTSKFYSSERAIELYLNSVGKIVNRKNSISKILYKNDPTIMSWQLCNEPRGMKNELDYLKWIEKSANYIKSLDSNHLVSVGSEGYTSDKKNNGTDFLKTHSFKNIDYTTAHLWIQNWGFYNPKQHIETYSNAINFAKEYLKEHVQISYELNKPFVLEEFGIMKDNGSFSYEATTKNRDSFYSLIFNEIVEYSKQKKASGVNFWAWGGFGRPRVNGGWWKVGDEFIGDPPHEQQGWYSVYNTDTSTHQVIKKYSLQLNNPQK